MKFFRNKASVLLSMMFFGNNVFSLLSHPAFAANFQRQSISRIHVILNIGPRFTNVRTLPKRYQCRNHGLPPFKNGRAQPGSRPEPEPRPSAVHKWKRFFPSTKKNVHGTVTIINEFFFNSHYGIKFIFARAKNNSSGWISPAGALLIFLFYYLFLSLLIFPALCRDL